MNSLKYQRSTTFGCKGIEVRKSEFVAKTQFLCRIKHRWKLIFQKVVAHLDVLQKRIQRVYTV